jgi:cytoskeletal protein RodZ
MADIDPDQRGLTVGERLREAREAKGLSLDDVASQTRIPLRHLQHIETGNWEALPAVTYSVGFARSYANAVGLDGSQVGAEVRQQLGASRGVSPAAEYYEPADPARVPPRSLAIATAVIAVLLIAAYLLFRSMSDVPDTGEAVAPPAEQQQAAPQQPVQPQQPPSAAGQPVTLTATANVWLRVTDGATNDSLIQRELREGETFQVPATAQRPVLRVGRPESLRITVGQTVIPQLGPSGVPIGNVSLRPEELVARAQGGGAAAPAAPAPAAGQPQR